MLPHLPGQNRLAVVPRLDLDPLRLAAGQIHHQLVPLLPDDQVLVPEPTRQEKRFLGRVLFGQELLVLGDPRLHRVLHLVLHLVEPIGRHNPPDALVRPLEVVKLDPVADPLDGVLEGIEYGLLQKLLPKMAPKRLDLPERLRMMRPGTKVPDAVALQDLLEPGLPTPGGILPPVVREHLLGQAILADRALQNVAHRLACLLRYSPQPTMKREQSSMNPMR